MRLFQRAAENGINGSWIVDAMVNFHCVLIHLRATVRANHFWFRHAQGLPFD
jgi:hypothetical protein